MRLNTEQWTPNRHNAMKRDAGSDSMEMEWKVFHFSLVYSNLNWFFSLSFRTWLKSGSETRVTTLRLQWIPPAPSRKCRKSKNSNHSRDERCAISWSQRTVDGDLLRWHWVEGRAKKVQSKQMRNGDGKWLTCSYVTPFSIRKRP